MASVNMSSEEVLAYLEGLKNRGFLPPNFGSSEGENDVFDTEMSQETSKSPTCDLESVGGVGGNNKEKGFEEAFVDDVRGYRCL